MLLRGTGVVPLLNAFKFDPAAVTMTPSMAVRAGTVFAGAPMVQGKYDGTGTPDVLSFLRGAQISGNWYANFDGNQGGGFCVWRPEQSTRTERWEFMWRASSTYYLAYDNNYGRYELRIGDRPVRIEATLTPGTSEILAWGFDCTNKLDGTNYAYLSRNDAQTYGATTQPIAAAPDATIYVGGNGTGSPLNGLIEGLTFVREVPWTGSYGTNMGAGDVVAAHAAGADVCKTIGAWGVTFCLPTNATPGALATGTGHAWSLNHAANVLSSGDGFCITTYGSSGWATVGTPTVAPADMAAANKIYLGGYTWTCSAANEGIEKTLSSLTAGADYVLRVVAHCTSADDIRVRIWDETNGEQARKTADFDFGASSSRTAPGVAIIAFELPTIARSGAAANCTSISVQILGTAAAQVVQLHQVEHYANLIDNPSMATGAVADPFVPDGWTNGGLDAGDSETEAVTVHSGVASLQFNTGASGEHVRQLIANTSNGFWFVGGFYYGDGSVGFRHYLSSSVDRAFVQYDPTIPYIETPVTAVWSATYGIARKGGGDPPLPMIWANSGASGVRYADDFFAVLLSAVSLTATPASAENSVESSGIRIDGKDTCKPTAVNSLKAGSGKLRIGVRPRHAAAKWAGHGNTIEYDLDMYQSAGNYIRIRRTANTVTMAFIAQGAAIQSGTWDATGAWDADSGKVYELAWTGSAMTLKVDGTLRITITAACVFAADFAASQVYVGSRYDGTLQGDAVYYAP